MENKQSVIIMLMNVKLSMSFLVKQDVTVQKAIMFFFPVIMLIRDLIIKKHVPIKMMIIFINVPKKID